MCGIVGVIHTPQAAEEIFLGLQNLQHRGQDGGGIVTLFGNQLIVHRGAGLVDIAFPEIEFHQLKGSCGLGHTRYATVGKKTVSMLQPFVNHALGLSIAHNGNIVNFHQQAQAMGLDVTDIPSGCDSELILWTLSQELKTHGQTEVGLVKSLQALSQQLIGSYAVVGVSETLGLFGFRDPYGLRPLVMGKKQNENGTFSYAFASESMALEFIGYQAIEDIAPGELVMISHNGDVYRTSYALPQPRHCMFEWVYFARVESVLEDLPVYRARFNLGLELGNTVLERGLIPDIVVPVPETSRIAAIALAERLNVPFREVLIKNRYVNRTFILESQAARMAAIKRKLYPVSSELKGKTVMVVDDSIVRGNTAIQIIKMIRACGAKAIYLASTCPPIQFPCYYGIDFPVKEELLAGQYSEKELPGVLDVEALVYQSVEGLHKALKPDSLCTACLTGNYPTNVEAGERFGQERTKSREVLPT